MKKTILFAVAALLLYVVLTHPVILSSIVGMATNQHPMPLPALLGGQAQAAGTPITGKPTISASFIDTQLCTHHSPACGTGQSLYDLGKQNGIDPAYALAFFWHESNYGVNGVARLTKSLGNMQCTKSYPCSTDGFASFPTWQAGYQAWYALITSKTYVGGGRTTLEQIIPVYAPAGSNDPASYIASVVSSVKQYRAESH